MRKKTVRPSKRKVVVEEETVHPQSNGDKKIWKLGDLKFIKPMTHTQGETFTSYFSGNQLVLTGSAGTGKTYCAIFLAMRSVLSAKDPQEKLIIVRSAVASRDVGFLPGTLEEKMSVLSIPYIDILGDLFHDDNNTFKNMVAGGLVQFMSTSYIRGLTIDNAVIVVDESQNLTTHEINSIMTRVGRNSRVIFSGDVRQSDTLKRGETEGFSKLIEVAKTMKEFDVIEFLPEDCVRSGLCRQWILATEKFGW